MTREETAQYAIQAVTRAAMREDFTTKLGPFDYSVGKYAKLTRAVIPIDDPGRQTYLLLSFDVGSDAVGIIENKIMKFLKDLLVLNWMQQLVSLQFPSTLGIDFSGVIKEVGEGVSPSDLKAGDEVYGQAGVISGESGAFAEMALANKDSVANKPNLHRL